VRRSAKHSAAQIGVRWAAGRRRAPPIRSGQVTEHVLPKWSLEAAAQHQQPGPRTWAPMQACSWACCTQIRVVGIALGVGHCPSSSSTMAPPAGRHWLSTVSPAPDHKSTSNLQACDQRKRRLSGRARRLWQVTVGDRIQPGTGACGGHACPLDANYRQLGLGDQAGSVVDLLSSPC
jgi:hypothetical protein